MPSSDSVGTRTPVPALPMTRVVDHWFLIDSGLPAGAAFWPGYSRYDQREQVNEHDYDGCRNRPRSTPIAALPGLAHGLASRAKSSGT